ncbi:MAG: hypothetical protein U0792_07395 [Gemmataceae bacterium]
MASPLPQELFAPEGVWLLAVAPLAEKLAAIIQQVVRTGDVENPYVPAFTTRENAEFGIAWLSPGAPDELVPFTFPEPARFNELLSALAILGHAYLVLNPGPDHQGERIAIRAIVRALDRQLRSATPNPGTRSAPTTQA